MGSRNSPIFKAGITRPSYLTPPDEPAGGTVHPVGSQEPVAVGTSRLSLRDVVEVAREGRAVATLAAEVRARMLATAAWVEQTVSGLVTREGVVRETPAYYGINTGFGALAGRTALDSEYLIKLLGRNLIASHSVGVGPYFEPAVVRAALLIRAQSLAQGRSGARPLIVETLCRMLNAGIYPAVPEQGSLGASGDRAPLAHLILTICSAPITEPTAGGPAADPTDGEAFVRCDDGRKPDAVLHLTEDYLSGAQTLWRRVPGGEAMAAIGGKIELHAKEALALSNGSTVSAAIAALVLHDAKNLLDHAALAVAMTIEGIRGFRDPFFPLLHRSRGHERAEHFGLQVLRYLDGSELGDPGDLRTNPKRIPPQDPYSIRCAPQVHGSIADTMDLAERWVEMEINAATDNPLIFPELERSYKAVSGGNFHGEPIALAMDFVSIALAELGSMSERRMFTMNEYHPDQADDESGYGLSSFLVEEPPGRKGLNCGLMMLQATAAALVSDCKALAHPDSVDSIPSSGNQEDHVSMSLNAGRHAREIVWNMEHVVAMELLCAAQAIWLQLRKPGNSELRAGAGTRAACEELRAAGILPLEQDRVLFPDIRKGVRLLRTRRLLDAATRAIRELPEPEAPR
jgi:histidine ammonia-lyase